MGNGLAANGPCHFFCAGELGEYAQLGFAVPAFHLHDPTAVMLHDEAFGGTDESRALCQQIAQAAAPLKNQLTVLAERLRKLLS